ncbi:MAG: BACON domain-containing carbohydrate-binding protein, partial [Bryobacteraceae bacterium]|nr:BACON domain-containing carbohydrate-binding protein [Bryobacteraceae bacterium]
MTRFLAVVLLLLLAGISGNGQRGESGAGAVRRLNREILEAARARRSSGAALPPRLHALLRERAAHWRQLAAEDPTSALEAVLPAADRLALSSQGGAGLIESTGEWSGEFERWTADEFDRHTHTEFFGLRANGQTLRLHFAPGGAPPTGCGGALRVKGARLGNVAAVREATLERPAAGCLRTGEQRVAAVLVNLPGARLPSNVTNASVRSLLFGTGATLDAYWREASYGRAWATGNVFGPYDLNLSYQCNGSDILNSVQPLLEAAIAAADPEADFRQYDRLMLVVPQQNFCNVGGFATLGCSTLSSADGAFQASRAFIRADAVNLHTFAHEAGHNLGLGHSGALYYPAEPLGTLGASPAAEEYGNPWDVMGGATCGGSGLTGHYSSRHKFGLGWLQSSNLQSTASPGLYNLLPLEQSSTGVQTLRVRRGAGNDHWLWIEYRRPSGFDSSLQNCSAGNPFNGVLIHYEQPAYTGDNRTRLLDFGNSLALASNPARKAFAAALKAGQKWSDPYTQLSIEVLSAAESASLRISYDTPCATISPPSVSHAPPPQQGAVSVTAPGNCAVQAVSNDPAWITITGDTVFNGSRTLTYSLPDNPLPQRRTSSISVGRQTFIIVQEADNGQPAPVSVTPSSGGSATDTPQRFRLAYTDADGGVQLSEVSAVFNSFNSLVGGCYFAYFPGDRMLRLYGDDGGSWSSWTIGAARTLANSQCSLNVATATATVQGAILELAVDVTFAAPFSGSKEIYLAAKDLRGADSGRTLLGHWTAGAATCAVSGAASAASFPSGGGSGSFQISANLSSCPWSINGLPAWITVNHTSGSGPATVAFNVTANSGAARCAPLNVAGNSVTLGQAAAACAVSATSTTTGFGPGGGSGAVQISSNLSTCSWSIAGAPSWITLSRTGGTGPASAAFTVAANSGPSRSATLSVAGASITITQSAAACVLSASATLTSFGPAAASATFQIGSNLSTCAWSISGAPAWITLNQSSGTGPASVGFTIAANAGAARGATVSVAGVSIAISHSAAAPAGPSGLRFVPVTPCRAADTRQGSGKSGSLGPPSLIGGTSRSLPMPNAGCGLPATAKAYAVNVTVVPR